jgi:hypothetical protein
LAANTPCEINDCGQPSVGQVSLPFTEGGIVTRKWACQKHRDKLQGPTGIAKD